MSPFPPERTTEHVPLHNGTPFTAFVVSWSVKPPKPSLTVVVKATYRLTGDGLRPAEEQRPPDGDVRDGDGELGEGLLYASDFAPFKPKADVTVSGYAYPGDDGCSGLASLEVGRLRDTLAVFGPRRWDALGAQSAPERFERVPLSYRFSWGGPDRRDNPVGLGMQGDLLPQLENPKALVQSRSTRVEPWGWSPIAAEWPTRAKRLGQKYGVRWAEERWPYFAEDFDWAYFNAAPPRLQVPHLRGDERFVLRGVCPGGERLQGQLPGVAVRIFAWLTTGEMRGATASLDTLHFDADEQEVVVCWRAVLETTDIDASELSCIFVTRDPLEVEPAPAEVAERLKRLLTEDEDDALTEEEEEEPLPAPPAASRDAVQAALASGEDLRGVDAYGADLSGLDFRGRDLSEAMLSQANLEGADLRGAILVDALLRGARARDAQWGGANLSGADLGGCQLDGGCFDRASLVDAALDDARAHGATFVGADLSGASASRLAAELADFREANLTHVDLSLAVLIKARFDSATLADAVLYEARMEGARFTDVEGTDVRADDANLVRTQWSSAKLGGGSFENAHLDGAVFNGAMLDESNFARARLVAVQLEGCRLRRSSWRKAALERVSLFGSDLMQADFSHARLTEVDFRRASLFEAETWGAEISGLLLEGAYLDQTKWKGMT